jgi:hypothetical protein
MPNHVRIGYEPGKAPWGRPSKLALLATVGRRDLLAQDHQTVTRPSIEQQTRTSTLFRLTNTPT